MTRQEACEALIGETKKIGWESTPLYSAWDNGDFPEGTHEDDFVQACNDLARLKDTLKIEDLPRWCQIYVLLN